MHNFFGSMVLGLEVSDGSPLAFTLVDKLDFFISFVMFPIYFIVCGGRINLIVVTPQTGIIVGLMSLLSILSKFIATILPCVFLYGMFLTDVVTVSLVLNSIGILNEERLESLYIGKSVLQVQGESLYKLNYTNIKKENIQLPYTYNLTSPPQTHGGLRETILSLEAETRKIYGGRGLMKILAN